MVLKNIVNKNKLNIYQIIKEFMKMCIHLVWLEMIEISGKQIKDLTDQLQLFI